MFGPIATFRQRLQAGDTLIGTAVSLTDPVASEALADSVDFLWLDQEHSTMSPEMLRANLMAARAKERPCFVRVTEGSTPFIKPVLDAGASGIVAPQVRTVDEVRRVVADCRYPPVGTRGFGPLVPTNYARDGGPDYVQRANEGIFVAVMIETAEAVDAIADIVAVPGLDSIVIGPNDLSGSLGVLGDVEHPRVVAAMEEVIAEARAAGVHVGAGMGLDPDYAVTLALRGVQWLQFGVDVMFLIEGMDRLTAAVRGKLEAR